jgi:Na+-transporting NADH:ubiquinone oxidoreductase subunit NqrC
MGRMERSIMRKLLLVFLLLCLTSIIINNAYSVELQPKAKVVEILDKIEQIEKEEDKVYWNKITTVKPKNAADQYCYVKVIIKESDNQLIKEEILECADGRKRVDGPTYWELFAEFYYTDMAQPKYCRAYSREKHAFKTPGKVCLKINGEWEIR